MKITKFGHSCLLIEEGPPAGGARIIFDPGSYSSLQNTVENVDAILITHEHQDHLNLESLSIILKNSPTARIFTNEGVGKKLAAAGVPYALLLDGQSIEVKGVLIEGFGRDHALIYPTYPVANNVGYRIAKKFFYGGDSITNIVPCEILAYPAIAPWARVSELVDYLKAIKPRVAFPVHDAFLKTITGLFYKLPADELTALGATWVVIEEGKTIEV